MSGEHPINETFSHLEIDTIGEIMNISMGAAATAASTLLDNRVSITTPVVKIVPIEEFEISQFQPAIAVEIKYVEGLMGSNILILRREDIRKILSQMLMMELPENFTIDEMAESAICELMNQMMGSSATVLSTFLGRDINISTPSTIPIDRLEDFKAVYFGAETALVNIEFTLGIDNVMESQFISALQIDLAKEIINMSLQFDSVPDTPAPPPVQAAPVQQRETPPPPPPLPPEPVMPPQEGSMPPQQPAPIQGPQAGYHQPAPAQQMAPPYPQAMPGGYQQPYYPYPQAPMVHPQPGYGEAPAPIVVKDYDFGDFGHGQGDAAGQHTNLDLVMNVPVMVTVELGRTKRKIKDILEFGQGTIVELDKQAGSQVDVIVNGQLIARGDVVVVDDNFSIRITEILKNRDNLNLL